MASPARAVEPLKVGAYPANPPWEYKAADGHFDGFEIDVVNDIAKRLSTTAVFQDFGFQALFAGVSSGRIDMAISSITITPERLKNQAFTQPLLRQRRCDPHQGGLRHGLDGGPEGKDARRHRVLLRAKPG